MYYNTPMAEKPYTPSPEEIQQAEETMTEEQKEASEQRAHELREREKRIEIPARAAQATFEQKESSRENFYEIERFERDWGIVLSEEQKAKLEKFPWPQEVLVSKDPFDPEKEVRETHFAFPGLDKIKLTVELEPYAEKLGLPNEFPTTLANWYKFLKAREAWQNDMLKEARKEGKKREEEVREELKTQFENNPTLYAFGAK